jgi:cystathionine beta-lyase
MQIEFLSRPALRERRGSKWSTHGADILPATPAEGDMAPCPAVRTAMASWLRRQQFGYPLLGAEGASEELKRTFTARAATHYGWRIAPDDLWIAQSPSQAVAACVQGFTKRRDEVLLQSPAFPGFGQWIALAQRRPVRIPMKLGPDGFGVAGDLDLDGAVNPRLLLICHPHNPTGRVFGRAELEPLADHARRNALFVVSDEVHADLLLDRRSHQPFATLFPELAESTVTIHSANKSFGLQGLGCALVHFGSQQLRKRFFGALPAPVLGDALLPGVLATQAAWDEDPGWLSSLLRRLEVNREYALGRLAAEAPAVRAFRPQSTYFLWLDFSRTPWAESPVVDLLRTSRIATAGGTAFGAECASWVRMVTACAPQTLSEMLDRMIGDLSRAGRP